jgi:hypothetical protein
VRNILDKEDRVLFKRDLKNLNKWIESLVKENKPAHPFYIVGENKGKQHEHRQTKN